MILNNFLPAVIKLKGGLGNQLFQFCYGRMLANRYRFKVYFDARGLQNSKSPRNFELQNFELYKYHSKDFIIDSKLNHEKFPRLICSLYFRLGIKHFENNSDFHLIPKPGIHFGYWQNRKVLEYISSSRDMFNISKEFQLTDEKAEIFNSNSIGVHIRGTDYLEHPNLLKLDSDYYKKGIEYIAERMPDFKLYVFTDDIVHTKKILNGVEYQLMERQSPVIDFYLLQSCKHQIIANSTFSFLAALLNLNKRKIVIAPGNWEVSNKNYLIANGFIHI